MTLERHSSSTLRSRLSCALLIVVALAGCATEFFYNRLDTLASWYFEDLVSLSEDQRHELRDWLERTLAWHRRTELRRYADFVEEIATTVAKPGDHASYQRLRVRFEEYVHDLVNTTAPDVSRLLLELSPAQTSEMLDSLSTKASERLAKNAKAVASNKWQREQREDFEKQLRRWTGDVSDQQEQIIAEGVRQLEPTYRDWAVSQQVWRDRLRAALEGDHADAATQERISALLREPQRYWTDAYAQKIARNRDRYMNTLVAIDVTLSPAQRIRLRDELRKLAGQLQKLAQGNDQGNDQDKE